METDIQATIMINGIYIYASHSILYLCEHVISKVRYSLRGFSFSLDLKHWRITVVFLLLSNIIIWLSSRPCLWRLTPIWDIPLADLAISQYQILYVKMMLKLFHGGLSLLEFYKLHVWRIECTACEFCACCVHIYLSFTILGSFPSSSPELLTWNTVCFPHKNTQCKKRFFSELEY